MPGAKPARVEYRCSPQEGALQGSCESFKNPESSWAGAAYTLRLGAEGV